jgi:hypothetical protein
MKHKVKGGEQHGRHNYCKEGHVHHNPQVMHQILMAIIVQKIEELKQLCLFAFCGLAIPCQYLPILPPKLMVTLAKVHEQVT